MNDIIDKIASRIKGFLGLATIEAVTDSDEIQLVKISGLDDEVQSDIERVQEYGITTNPPVGSGAVVLYVGGNRDHGVVIKTDSGEFRIQSLKSGEVCIYSQHGQKILLAENGDIVFNDGTDFMAGFTDLKTGFDTLRTELNALVTAYNAHVHNVAALPSVGSPPPTIPTLPTATSGVPAVATIDAAKIEEIKIP